MATYRAVSKILKNNAADATADTTVGAANIEPPIAPLDSALKNGLLTMLWIYHVFIYSCGECRGVALCIMILLFCA